MYVVNLRSPAVQDDVSIFQTWKCNTDAAAGDELNRPHLFTVQVLRQHLYQNVGRLGCHQTMGMDDNGLRLIKSHCIQKEAAKHWKKREKRSRKNKGQNQMGDLKKLHPEGPKPNGWVTRLNWNKLELDGWLWWRNHKGSVAPKKTPKTPLQGKTSQNWLTHLAEEDQNLYHKGRTSGHTPLREVSVKILAVGTVKGKPPYLYIFMVVLCGCARPSASLLDGSALTSLISLCLPTQKNHRC